MPPVVIYPSPGKTLKLVGLGIVFVALGVAFAAWQSELGLPGWAVAVCSYIGVPFFGLATLYGVYRLAKPSPAVVLDEEGLIDHASAVSVGRVAWREVDRLVVHELMGNRMLGIVPQDEAAVMARLNPVKRWLLHMNRGMGLPPINIPESMLPSSAEELLEQIKPRIERAKVAGNDDRAGRLEPVLPAWVDATRAPAGEIAASWPHAWMMRSRHGRPPIQSAPGSARKP